ncbi:nuclear transport factor 2 family protein [Actinobacillus capsulatus]|uniref:nuclear transport factor 2 family protein n=1 Tax=Actinobacillus capsulatus TaxID=717 RepID=UPI00036B0A8A|nr:nuclear transport factor 2 family protein [Actinobacillus capsulatus]
MTFNIQIERQALKDLVDTFSNLADEKKVKEQMNLFTPDAVVNTYIGGELVFAMEGVAQIEQVFSDYLAPFSAVYHLNGQHTVTFQDNTHATAINYCQVALVREENGRSILLSHYVRYNDTYVKQGDKWLITNRIANFMISEERKMGR